MTAYQNPYTRAIAVGFYSGLELGEIINQSAWDPVGDSDIGHALILGAEGYRPQKRSPDQDRQAGKRQHCIHHVTYPIRESQFQQGPSQPAPTR